MCDGVPKKKNVGIDGMTLEIRISKNAVTVCAGDESPPRAKTVSLEMVSDGTAEYFDANRLKAVVGIVRELFEQKAPEKVEISSDLFGAILLGEAGEPLYSAITDGDARSFFETEFLNEAIGRERMVKYTGMEADDSLLLPKLMWLRKNEPFIFQRAATVLQPAGYLCHLLTGEKRMSQSEAKNSMLLDPELTGFSERMLRITGMPGSMLPGLVLPWEIAGNYACKDATAPVFLV